MARVGPRSRHRGILHRPGLGELALRRVVRLTAGWASSHSRVGDACCLQQACPPKRSSCFRIDLEINVQ